MMQNVLLIVFALATHADANLLARSRQQEEPVTTNPTKVVDHSYSQKAYDADWQNEYDYGEFPSFKKTYSKTWRFDNVQDMQDEQSDGKPSTGLTGKHVGAYLKTPLEPTP